MVKSASSVTLLVLSLVGLSEQGAVQRALEDSSYESQPAKKSYHGYKHKAPHAKPVPGENLRPAVFYADAETAEDVRHYQVGRVYDSRDNNVCMKGCDAKHHCFNPETDTCQIPSCSVPAPPPAPVTVTIAHAQQQQQYSSQQQQYGSQQSYGSQQQPQGYGAQSRKLGGDVGAGSNYMEQANPQVQAPLIKKKHHNKRNSMQRDNPKVKHDDDDDRLPDDDRAHSTGGAAYVPVDKHDAAALAIDAKHYHQCSGGAAAGFNYENNYEYHAWDLDHMPSYGETAQSVAQTYRRQLENMQDDYLAPLSRTHHFDGRALSENVGECSCKCPGDTIDVRCLRVHKTGWVFQLVTSIGLFAPFFWLIASGFRSPRWMTTATWLQKIADLSAAGGSKADIAAELAQKGPLGELLYIRREVLLMLALAGFVQSIAYMTMVLGPGFIVNCHMGRQIFWARAVAWLISQPMVMWALTTLSGSSWNDRFSFVTKVLTMVLATVISTSARSSAHWLYYIFRMMAFFAIMCHLLCLAGYNSRLVISKWEKDQMAPLISRIAVCILLGWGGQATVWMFSEGSNWICVDWAEILYCFCDLISITIPAVLAVTYVPQDMGFLPVLNTGS